MTKLEEKCGYVVFLGRPNAGKSTLMNALLKAKISIVSAKPQTTRNKILGILTEENCQLLFLDTPGIHSSAKLPKMNKLMNNTVWASIDDADIVCYLIDIGIGWHAEDDIYLQNIISKIQNKPLMIIASKIDKYKKDEVEEAVVVLNHKLQELKATLTLSSPNNIPNSFLEFSAKRPEDLSAFKLKLKQNLPSSPWLYSEDSLTDKPDKFICSEIIREQLFRQLGQELPYSCAVKIDKFREGKNKVTILATIIVQKNSHKPIVIGSKGSKLKVIGTEARLALEKHLQRQVFLSLFVKVQENWLDNDVLLAEYAHMEKD